MTGRAGFPAAVAVALLLGVTACVVPRASVGPEGRLEVLGPAPGFSPKNLPADWVIEGPERAAAGRLSVVHKDGAPALRVVNGPEGFVIARRVDAALTDTRHLSWAWNLEAPEGGVHPVHLLVGFHGGDPESPSWGGQPFVWTGSALPPRDRTLALTWTDSALHRGDPPRPRAKGRALSRYAVRGGRENAGAWWSETVDLAQLYGRAWPTDDIDRVRVMFVGVAATGGRPPAAAYLSRIVLSH